MILIFLVIGAVSLLAGSVHIDFGHVSRYLAKALTGDFSITSQEELILFSVRLPRIICWYYRRVPFPGRSYFSSDSEKSFG